MKFLSLILALLLWCSNVNAQQNDILRDQKRGIIITNLMLNAFVGGIGSIVNERPNQKIPKVFAKGFSQGLLGATVQHWGKELSWQIVKRRNINYAWPTRIVHSIGASITYNAASNLNFWEAYHFHLGPLKIRYVFSNKIFKARLNPINLTGIYVFGSQAKFSLSRTFASGILVFESQTKLTKFSPYPTDGLAGFGMFGINAQNTPARYYEVFAHETMHVLQSEGQLIVNPFFIHQDKKLKSKYKWYNTLNQFVELDLSSFTNLLIYQFESLQAHHCRFTEREAHIYSNRELLRPCN